MCLNTIKGTPEQSSGEGYKDFRKDSSSHLSFMYYTPEGEKSRIKYDHWYKESSEMLLEDDIFPGVKYPVGFHVYLDRPYLFNERRVSYRGAHTEGAQVGRSVIVAKEILIHRKGE